MLWVFILTFFCDNLYVVKQDNLWYHIDLHYQQRSDIQSDLQPAQQACVNAIKCFLFNGVI